MDRLYRVGTPFVPILPEHRSVVSYPRRYDPHGNTPDPDGVVSAMGLGAPLKKRRGAPTNGGNDMATVDLTTKAFEETIKKDGVVLVDFWAEWCHPCKMFGPIFEASSDANTGVIHGKVDTEAEPGLGASLGVTAIPTLMAFRDGVLVFRQAGALPAPALKQVIDEVNKLDMDEVRKEIADHEAGHKSKK